MTVDVQHEYVCMGPMTDKNMCYMVMKTLGVNWLKIITVILLMSDQK